MTAFFQILAALTVAWAGVSGACAAEFNCLIEPRKVVELRSPSTGVVDRVDAERGQIVRAGQMVVSLDSGLERAALDIARHRATMEGAIKTGESRLEFSTLKLKRREELLAQKFVSAQDRDESNTEMRLAQSELLDARDNRRLAALEVRRSEEQIRLRSIRSPVTGVVIERNVHVGELADPGEQRKPLLRIADISTLYVEAVLPAEAYAHVRMGQRGQVRADLPVKINATAKVSVVDKVLDAASGTFGVRLELPNPQTEIPAGIACRVDLPDVPATPARREQRRFDPTKG
jgi:RND family efflux transporter MFP subunit